MYVDVRFPAVPVAARELRILGPIQVEGARVPGGRPRALLALLLVARGELVPLDRVVDELWEGDGPRHARKAAHVVACRLRRVLGGDALRCECGGYRLRLPRGAVDADRFEALAQRAAGALARGDAAHAAALARQALALWRGPALADVAAERFAQPEIARLEELRFACLTTRIDADLACGRHAAVVGELEALVRAHPLREGLRAQQMLALYGAGRPADALAAYQDAYAALTSGLGVPPSPRLRAIETAILRHDLGAETHDAAAGEAAVKPAAARLAPCAPPALPLRFRPPVLR
jgi:DNA-binding SARP family transcriptional activator